MPYSRVAGEPEPKASDLRSGTETLLDLMFAMPRWAGYGEHWELDDSERKEISAQLQACLKRLPKSKTAKLAKMVDKYAPFFGLAAAGYAAVAPRVQATRELITLRKMELERDARNAAAGSPAHAAGRNDGSASGSVQARTDFDFQDGSARSESIARADSGLDRIFVSTTPLGIA